MTMCCNRPLQTISQRTYGSGNPLPPSSSMTCSNPNPLSYSPPPLLAPGLVDSTSTTATVTTLKTLLPMGHAIRANPHPRALHNPPFPISKLQTTPARVRYCYSSIIGPISAGFYPHQINTLCGYTGIKVCLQRFLHSLLRSWVLEGNSCMPNTPFPLHGSFTSSTPC
ncbi:unnamed protein product [Periconia digitata]|uniref:Uncharacterized protein n=1 Tax=Periconia digitata TaxID=1303443 RepID=A0A9W4UC86_9PLEO|nr:unnamed protein product [Periconia digitata]